MKVTVKLQEALGRTESSQQLGKLVSLKANPKLGVPSHSPSAAIPVQQQAGPATPAVAGTAFRKPSLLALGDGAVQHGYCPVSLKKGKASNQTPPA